MKSRLDRDAWIAAGLAALAEGGVEAVRVERLAAMLRITKGSFYWHFQDRPALLAALLEAWQAAATGDIITHVEARGETAEERLRHLMTIVTRSDGRLDMAIRDWASRDPTAASAMAAVDARRLAYVAGLFEAIGFKRPEALARARFAYHALIGQFRMADQPVEERLADVVGIILPVLTRRD
ncbi:TetR family transcriptional regulator [Phreatobacter sp.]|uniref:TetR family transcriptional regulator n=1 Tax=Phreatobacter sp. TaxID=1966341 RepID=UPI003F72A6C4